jgi:hypothetical protein
LAVERHRDDVVRSQPVKGATVSGTLSNSTVPTGSIVTEYDCWGVAVGVWVAVPSPADDDSGVSVAVAVGVDVSMSSPSVGVVSLPPPLHPANRPPPTIAPPYFTYSLRVRASSPVESPTIFLG